MGIANLLNPKAKSGAQEPAAGSALPIAKIENPSHLLPGIKSPKIMIVDDEGINIRVVRKYLQKVGYESFVEITDSKDAFETMVRERPDLVLLDVMMPDVDGLAILHLARNESTLRDVPIIILTAASDGSTKLEALDLGATEFLTKPVDRVELLLRVRNALLVKSHLDELSTHTENLEQLVRERTQELEVSRKEVVNCLARAAESRDGDTGQHVLRVGAYSGVIAREIGFPESYVEIMIEAAKLHDVGKIGIPDAILLKPGKLETHEYQLMKSHCSLGTDILHERHSRGATESTCVETRLDQIMTHTGSPLLKLAAVIAQTHHEKWDGTGYPLGLKGEQIPIEGRIVAVADVFDALNNSRPYKKAFPLKRCFEILRDGRGTHFDARVVDAFFRRHQEILEIKQRFAD